MQTPSKTPGAHDSPSRQLFSDARRADIRSRSYLSSSCAPDSFNSILGSSPSQADVATSRPMSVQNLLRRSAHLRDSPDTSGRSTSDSTMGNSHDQGSPCSAQLWLETESNRKFHQRLNEQAAETERQQREALALSAEEHDRVRQSALNTYEYHQLELENERRRREAEERAQLEAARAQGVAEHIETQRRQMEDMRRQEEERQRVQQAERELKESHMRLQREREEAEAREVKRLQDEELRSRQASEAVERQRAESQAQEAANAKAAREEQQQRQSQAAVNSSIASSTPAKFGGADDDSPLLIPKSYKEQQHQIYLGIHQKLKKMRKEAQATLKQDPALKTRLGEMRRDIRKSMGQFTMKKAQNKVPLSNILKHLRDAAGFTKYTTDVSPFLASPPTNIPPISLLLLYLMNIFSKLVIQQVIAAGVSPKSADAFGVAAVSIFSDPAFLIPTAQSDPTQPPYSLIDILLAKYHVVCPVLFGISAPPNSENTQSGRLRLGWGRTEPGGPFVTEQTQSERMVGLGAGFAALSLRDFSGTSVKKNPFPPTHYWTSIASLLNTPPEEIGLCQLCVIRAMLEHSVERFITFYGSAALAVMRRALLELPAELKQQSAGREALRVLPEVIQREYGLTL